ncbi:MAG: hypothetical protein ACRELY_14850, partial [Polyangiaceae bacterium]
MPRLSNHEIALIRAIENELEVRVEGARPVMETIVAPLRQLLQTDIGCSHSLAPSGDGLRLDEIYTDNWPAPERAARAFNDYLQDRVVGWALYNPIRPEKNQRDVVMRIADFGIAAQEKEGLLHRIGVGGMDQMRVLICEGSSLIAWV